MSDVTIAGKKVPRWAAIAGGAGGLIAIWIVWRNHQANAAAAASSTTAIDPLTGDPQGSPDDLAALAAQQSSAYGYSGGGSGGGTYPVYSGGTQVGTTSAVSYPDNASWSQAVEAGLSSIGYSETDVASAIGRYLGRLPLTSSQANIVHVALAEYNDPPAGTYQVILQPSGAGTPVTAVPSSAPSGLSATPYAGSADFGWTAVSRAAGYDVTVTGAGGKGTGTSHLNLTETGNHAGHVQLAKGAYRWQVRATNSAGAGPWSAWHDVTVK